MPRLAKPSDQPQAQRERVCKTRYGENAAGKWVRRSAFREVDYAPDDPTKLREFATFAEAFAFDEACRADGTGGRSAKYAAQPKSSVPEEQRAVCTAIADALKEDGNETRVQLASVEDGVHERFDVLGGQVEALAREVQQNMQPRPDQLQMMVELSAPSVSVSTLNAMLMKAQIMCKGLKVQKAKCLVEKLPVHKLQKLLAEAMNPPADPEATDTRSSTAGTSSRKEDKAALKSCENTPDSLVPARRRRLNCKTQIKDSLFFPAGEMDIEGGLRDQLTTPQIIVNTDCSGMEAPLQALCNLGLEVTHGFSSDIDPHVRATINANFPPKHCLYRDLTKRDHAKAPTCNLYVAGFPCQPFSTAGLQQGFNDSKKRGKIFFHIRDYIEEQTPKVFMLENVSGLVKLKKGQYFQAILESLKMLSTPYNIYHHLLDTKDHGVPQSRKRVYIIGIRQDVDQRTFTWPEKLPLPSIEEFLDPRDPDLAATGLPPPRQGTARRNVQNKLQMHKEQGEDPHMKCFVVDCGSSEYRCKSVEGVSPCITCSRGDGHWVTNRGRRFTKAEMLRLQGMDPSKFIVSVSEFQLGKQLGNTMSVNVLERILTRLLPAAGLVKGPLRDRWEDGSALKELSATRGFKFNFHISRGTKRRCRETQDTSAVVEPRKRLRKLIMQKLPKAQNKGYE